MATFARPEKLTYQDFLLLPEDGRRHELIGGEHLVTPSPSWDHQSILANLLLILGPFVKRRKLGRMAVAPMDVVLSAEDVVEPDLFFIAETRSGIIGKAAVHGAPDLVIEILSPSTRRRDEVLKRALYERVGVAEYWIVDPEEKTVAVHRANPSGLRRVAHLAAAAGDSLESPLFPGLSFQVAEIFE
jgi:Uma2 family endonuclease